MRMPPLLALLVMACGSTSEPPPEERSRGGEEVEDAPEAVESEPAPPASTRCPRRPLVAGEMSFAQAPTFSRELGLDFAISMADAVVEGPLDASGLRGTTLCAEARELGIEVRGPHPHHTDVRGEGVWMVVKTPQGYLVLNPERTPLERNEWEALVARAEPRSAEHGVEISGTGGDVHVVLRELGESQARIAFDRNGLERVVLNPPTGRGFMLQNARGALWRWEHYVDRELHGTTRTFERGSDRLRSEAHYRNGRMHGRVRHWEDGRVTRDVTYEDGLIAPVVSYSGEPGDARIHYGSDGDVSYSAPDDVMDAIRVGMRVRDVVQLLKLPVSPEMGVRFPSYRCEEALTIRFRRGQVAEREILPNGAHCM